MRVYGNLMNRLMEHTTAPKITVGMGATICFHSDRAAATVIKVSDSGKTCWLQEDDAKRTDKNGMSEMQTYEFTPNPNGTIRRASLRKNGTWKTTGGEGVAIGHRGAYYDFSF